MASSQAIRLYSYVLVILSMSICAYADGLSVECGAFANNSVQFTYTGDGYLVYSLSGRDKSQCIFTEHWQTKNFTLEAKFKSDNSSDCLMEEISPITKNYKMDVYVRMVADFMDTGSDLMYVVVCTYGKIRDGVRVDAEVEEQAVNAPKVVETQAGPAATSTFVVVLRNRDGEEFSHPPALGNAVTLKAIMTPGEGEVGFKVNMCEAQTTDGTKSATILVNGCGTGFPLAADKGFIGKGTEALTEKFRLFKISKYGGLAFSCNFISCKQNCDGPTCTTNSTSSN